ncbi:MAG: hypothetical protein ACTSV7_02120 [Candidatus Baldrarchaeia archaeon]
MSKMREDEESRTQKGLTWRSAFALIFAVVLIEPVMIYYNLITNLILPLQAWIVIILWCELSRALGSPLTKQEIFILLAFQQMALTYSLWFLTPIKNMFMANSHEARFLGVTPYVPSWWAPRGEVVTELMKTQWVYFRPEWITPLLLVMITACLMLIANITMGYFCYGIYVTVQKLEFPAATAQAQTVLTLAEREPTEIRILMLGALIGLIYNAAVYFLPFLIGPFLTAGGLFMPATTAASLAGTATSYVVSIFDLTPFLADNLPGAGFAFTLDFIPFVQGFLLPLSVTVPQVMGAFTFYFIGTHLITRFNLWPEESKWSSSWPINTLVDRSQLYFYISITIGLSLAATIIPLLLRPKILIQAFSLLKKASSKESSMEKTPPLFRLLAIFFGACLANVVLVHFLAPEFPLWILIMFIVGYSFFISFLRAYTAGVTFSSFDIPYQRELIIYSSGYRGRDVWFAPINIFSGGADIAQFFKIADMCNVSKREYVKTYIIVVAMGLVSSFIFVTLLWNISPIPSGAYPATIYAWPVDAMNWARTQIWIWKGYLFRYDLITYSFIIGAVVYAISDYVFHIPAFLISFLAGTAPQMGIPWSLMALLGSIFANKVLAPRLGTKTFGIFRGRFVIGFMLGYGFVSMLTATLILISRSMWLLPY